MSSSPVMTQSSSWLLQDKRRMALSKHKTNCSMHPSCFCRDVLVDDWLTFCQICYLHLWRKKSGNWGFPHPKDGTWANKLSHASSSPSSPSSLSSNLWTMTCSPPLVPIPNPNSHTWKHLLSTAALLMASLKAVLSGTKAHKFLTVSALSCRAGNKETCNSDIIDSIWFDIKNPSSRHPHCSVCFLSNNLPMFVFISGRTRK